MRNEQREDVNWKVLTVNRDSKHDREWKLLCHKVCSWERLRKVIVKLIWIILLPTFYEHNVPIITDCVPNLRLRWVLYHFGTNAYAYTLKDNDTNLPHHCNEMFINHLTSNAHIAPVNLQQQFDKSKHILYLAVRHTHAKADFGIKAWAYDWDVIKVTNPVWFIHTAYFGSIWALNVTLAVEAIKQSVSKSAKISLFYEISFRWKQAGEQFT